MHHTHQQYRVLRAAPAPLDQVRDLVARTMAEAIVLAEVQLARDMFAQTTLTLEAIDVVEVETIEAVA